MCCYLASFICTFVNICYLCSLVHSRLVLAQEHPKATENLKKNVILLTCFAVCLRRSRVPSPVSDAIVYQFHIAPVTSNILLTPINLRNTSQFIVIFPHYLLAQFISSSFNISLHRSSIHSLLLTFNIQYNLSGKVKEFHALSSAW